MSNSEPPRFPSRDPLSNASQVGGEKQPLKIEGDDAKKKKFDRYFEDEKKTEKKDKQPNVFDMQSEALKGKKETPSPVDLFLESEVEGQVVQGKDKKPTKGLPESTQFWDEVDLPPDQPVPTPHLEKKPASGEMIFERKLGQMPAFEWEEPVEQMPVAEFDKTQKHPAILPSHESGTPITGHAKEKGEHGEIARPFSKKEQQAAERPVPHHGAHAQERPLSKKEQKEIAAHQEHIAKKHGKEETYEERPFARPVSEKEKAHEPYETKKSKKGEEAQSAPFVAEQRSVSRGSREDGEMVGEAKAKKKQSLEAEAAPLASFPQSIQRVAVGAVQLAGPYLSEEVRPLFFQMVGNMFIMSTPPGITRTEVILNNQQMLGSQFFGAKITLEKYATAPDSYNIRLTGTPEAVALFQANAPSLLQAFHRGNFDFKVNRLDTEYETPLAQQRRRGGREGSESGSGGGTGEKGR